MDSAPLVSVIIPTVRRPRRLWRALESVAAQSYPAVEAVVVNDGGAPLDLLVARFRESYPLPLRYVALPRGQGISTARNAGVAAAEGTLVALLDDDDRFRPEHVARLARALLGDGATALAYDDTLIVIEAGVEENALHVIGTCRLGLPYDRARFERDDYIPPSSVVLRRADFVALGGFDPTLAMCEDWDFLLRLRARGAFHYVAGEIGVDYSLRLAAGDNHGSRFDATRRAALSMLEARYGLPPLEPKTFLDVARGFGLPVVPSDTAG